MKFELNVPKAPSRSHPSLEPPVCHPSPPPPIYRPFPPPLLSPLSSTTYLSTLSTTTYVTPLLHHLFIDPFHHHVCHPSPPPPASLPFPPPPICHPSPPPPLQCQPGALPTSWMEHSYLHAAAILEAGSTADLHDWARDHNGLERHYATDCWNIPCFNLILAVLGDFGGYLQEGHVSISSLQSWVTSGVTSRRVMFQSHPCSPG